jgi:hypothetical protein
MRYSIDAKVTTDILNYMANKPYNEVYQLIALLQADAKEIKEDIPEIAQND